MKLRILVCFCLLFVFVPRHARAAGEFKAGYDVNYAIAPTGKTTVSQDITLTNQFTNLYPQQYQLVIDSANISNVIAYDRVGAITPTIQVRDGTTEISLTFNDRVVGIGKQLHFTLRYENNDVAQKIGNIWEITVPGVVNDPDLEVYNVSLQVPPSFGPVAYRSPKPANGDRWTKDQMVRGGISAAYGSEQRFTVGLTYALDNPNVAPVETEIAIPPDTAFQKVAIESITPAPKKITRDHDGNWLARYELAAGGSLDVDVQVVIAITLVPRTGYHEDLTNPVDYLKPLKYWESENPGIIELARQYTTPRQIYDYVVKTLTYNYGRVEENPVRMGAVSALQAPDRAICMEFTDLFIALSRAAGIPARELVGYAYTTNAKLRPLSLVSDVLHAWPEYYDREKKLWVPVDPTWANTTGGVDYFDKLDFNHIVFAVHGLESDFPYPAGFYKREGKSGKDVRISFAPASENPLRGVLTTDIRIPERVTAGLPVRGTVLVHNTSGIAMDEAVIDITAVPGNVIIRRIEQNLPPFSVVSIPFSLEPLNIWTHTKGEVTVSVNGDVTRTNFGVRPLYWIVTPVSIGVGGIVGIIWLFIKRSIVWRRSNRS